MKRINPKIYDKAAMLLMWLSIVISAIGLLVAVLGYEHLLGGLDHSTLQLGILLVTVGMFLLVLDIILFKVASMKQANLEGHIENASWWETAPALTLSVGMLVVVVSHLSWLSGFRNWTTWLGVLLMSVGTFELWYVALSAIAQRGSHDKRSNDDGKDC